MVENPLLREFLESNDSELAKRMAEIFDATIGQTEDAQTNKMRDELDKILKEKLDEIREN